MAVMGDLANGAVVGGGVGSAGVGTVGVGANSIAGVAGVAVCEKGVAGVAGAAALLELAAWLISVTTPTSRPGVAGDQGGAAELRRTVGGVTERGRPILCTAAPTGGGGMTVGCRGVAAADRARG